MTEKPTAPRNTAPRNTAPRNSAPADQSNSPDAGEPPRSALSSNPGMQTTDDTPVHPAALPAGVLLAQCRVRFHRRGGPGGQHRNKVETAVALEHLPTRVTAEANERRSQMENRMEAIFRLRLRLAVAVRQRPSGGPSPLWKSRLREAPFRIGRRHDDFPTLLAEALDVFVVARYQPTHAAALLECSSSQLVRLCKQYPPAFQWLNDRRRENGAHRLK